MTGHTKVILGVLVGLAALFVAFSWWQGQKADARERVLEARVDSLATEVARRDSVVVAIDSAWAADSADRVVIRERADTVFRSAVDTIRAALPDSLQGALDALVRADSVEDAAYEADIAQLHERIRARDNALAERDSLLAAKTELIDHLRRPDPLTLELPFGFEAKPGFALGVDTRGKPNAVAGVTIQ